MADTVALFGMAARATAFFGWPPSADLRFGLDGAARKSAAGRRKLFPRSEGVDDGVATTGGKRCLWTSAVLDTLTEHVLAGHLLVGVSCGTRRRIGSTRVSKDQGLSCFCIAVFDTRVLAAAIDCTSTVVEAVVSSSVSWGCVCCCQKHPRHPSSRSLASYWLCSAVSRSHACVGHIYHPCCRDHQRVVQRRGCFVKRARN